MKKNEAPHPPLTFRALPRLTHRFGGMLLVLAVAVLLLWWKHGSWLGNANDHMLGGGGDGFKNYMTSAWHVAHDTSYVHYRGMNYPFGEHVLFTDNQPLISAALQWWSRHISDLSDQSVGIFNVLLVLSMAFGAMVLFLLLRKLHLPVWYAGLGALAIAFLSPQYNRFDGHFALAHTWVFPLILLLLCRYEERYSRRYQSLLIGVTVWLAAQIHFYYFGLAALFLGLYTLYQVIRAPRLRNIRTRLSHLVVMVLLPFVLLNVWIHWSHYATDRPASPYGFSYYIGYWEGVFLPYESWPLYGWIDRNIVSIRRINPEAWQYAGMVATLFSLWVLFRRFRLFGSGWDDAPYHRVHKDFLRGIFVAAVVLLIFACGFPFVIKGLEGLVEYFGPLKQFRGLGRFTWAFYYVINVLALYAAWNYARRFTGIRGGRAPWLRWVIALLPLALMIYEAAYFQTHKTLVLGPNYANREQVAADPGHWLNKVDFSKYQAILPLPYYHVGSENIWLDYGADHFRKTQMAAYHSGTPDMGVNMSRTPLGETVRSVQLALEPLTVPEMLNELPDNRPLALLMEPGSWDAVRRRHEYLVMKALPVYEDAEVKIMSLSPDSIRPAVLQYLRWVEGDYLSRNMVTRAGGWQTNAPGDFFRHTTFDSLADARHVFQGRGAYEGRIDDTTWLWRAPLPPGEYSISMWVYALNDMGMTQEIKIFQNTVADGRQLWYNHEGLRFHIRSIVQGWALYDVLFQVREPDTRVSIFLNKPGVNEPMYLDEVLLRPVTTGVYRRQPGWLIRNNYWFDLK
jgi:hypothetical protein